MPCDPNIKIVVNIWHSGINLKHKGAGSGHISIHVIRTVLNRTISRYISLWPLEGGKKTGLLGAYKSVPHELKSDYQADLDEEEREPETRIVFYSLNTRAICQEFDKIKSKINGWALFRGWIHQNGILLRKTKAKDSHSCASLALHLLQKGGLNKEIGSSLGSVFGSSHFSSVAPDALVPHIKKVKAIELGNHSKTYVNYESINCKNHPYYFEGETPVKPAGSKKCIVM